MPFHQAQSIQVQELIQAHDLQPHPEGGWYKETYRSPLMVQSERGQRAACTMITFLLDSHSVSRWHRVASDEIWQHLDGAPLQLLQADPAVEQFALHLIQPHTAQASSHAVVPAHFWQAAQTTGEWTLVACTVAPGFDFADFEMIDEQNPLAGRLADLPGGTRFL